MAGPAPDRVKEFPSLAGVPRRNLGDRCGCFERAEVVEKGGNPGWLLPVVSRWVKKPGHATRGSEPVRCDDHALQCGGVQTVTHVREIRPRDAVRKGVVAGSAVEFADEDVALGSLSRSRAMRHEGVEGKKESWQEGPHADSRAWSRSAIHLPTKCPLSWKVRPLMRFPSTTQGSRQGAPQTSRSNRHLGTVHAATCTQSA